MFLKGKLLVFLAGTLSFIWAKPHLQDNGYRDLLVMVGKDVPDEDANIVVEQIKDMLTVASEDQYYANGGRTYIKEVTIVVPNHWTNDMVPSLSGESIRGEIYQEADIQIGKKSRLMGEAPYVQQLTGQCGAPTHEEPGEPMQISVDYLRNLHYKRDQTIVNYGPPGKLFAQEFAKYHHGIYEEFGYPGKQDAEENAEMFPSMYLHSCEDEKGNARTCVVDNYCADVPLEGDRRNYERVDVNSPPVAGECVIDEASGTIESERCFFKAASTGQSAVTSIGSYQYTDMVTSFCDGSEWTPHNHEAPNLHNFYCEGQSQWDTILSHREFANGNNGPVWIEDTTPTFFVKKESTARFVLVIDYSGSMASQHRMDHLHTSAIRWITQLKPGTNVAIVKFGSSGQLVEAVPGKTFVDASVYQQELMKAIGSIVPNGGGTNMASGLKVAETIMMDPSSPGHAGTVMTFTDGAVNQGADIGSEAVWGLFKRNNIRVATVLMGTHKTANIEKLARETKGKVFTVDTDGKDLDDPFSWASQTWIPPEVASHYEWTLNNSAIPGREAVSCAATAKQCFSAPLSVDGQTNKEVTITMQLQARNGDPKVSDYFELAFVKEAATENVVGGFDYHLDEFQNQATLRHPRPPVGDFNVNINLKKHVGLQFIAQVKTTGHRSSDSAEPYEVTCKYPSAIGDDGNFLITGRVMQGNTVVKGATIAARISKSMDDEPSGTEKSCYAKLSDDGLEQYSGDTKAFDGVHSYIMDPRDFCSGVVNIKEVERMSVLCTMLSNPDTLIDENSFWDSKKMDARGLPMDDEGTVSPYCCGTSNQTWTTSTKIEHVNRGTYNTAVKNELSKLKLTNEEWLKADFGAPGRIADLKATRVGDQVELRWTGAGADPAYGTPAHYDVHYSTKRSNLYTKSLKTKSAKVTPLMLAGGSLEPVPIGEQMSITVNIPDLVVPGTYHFAVRAVDPHGNEGRSSNIVSVHFHDGSPILKDVSPHHVHGIHKVEMPVVEKLRKIFPDERMVQGALKKAEKNKQMLMEAENNVMEKRLRKRFGDNEKVLAKIINTIKTNPEQRELYKKMLL